MVPAKEHVFQTEANQGIVSSPINFSATLIFPKTFSSITIRSSSTIAGCHINLESHIIQPDSATTNWDLETIHYEWSLDSNMLFPKYLFVEFETTVAHLYTKIDRYIN